MTILDADNFKEEIQKSDIPVMVDFYADWCAPCKILSPIVEELSIEYEGKAKICKLDVQNNQSMAKEYKITGIPALIFFKGGVVADKIVGLVSKERIKEKLDGLL